MARQIDDDDYEPPLTVLMDRDRVVVRPVGHLDRESIETLLGLLSSAREAGLIAVVDLGGLDHDDKTP